MSEPAAAVEAPALEKLKVTANPDHIVDGEEDASSDEDEGGANGHLNGDAKKKKKKKKPKKKKGASTTLLHINAQTDPPTLPITKFFAPDNYPVGETHEYLNDNAYRTTSKEKQELERYHMDKDLQDADNWNCIRRAAAVHRQVRSYARKKIKPGMTMTEIADLIENASRNINEAEHPARGIGFPTGLSLNHVAAHYTPNPGDTIVLKESDVLKVDIGVQVQGRIVDSAFTLNFEPTYDKLLEAVREATNAGVKEAGIDVRVRDIGATVQEVMESYEVEVNDKNGQRTLPVKAIRNLTGHNIGLYNIHGGKSVPIVKGNETDVMEEGEYFAIETFGSTGRGYVSDEGACSHYALRSEWADKPAPALRVQSAKTLLATIKKEFGTIPFCRRYLDRVGETKHLLGLKNLVDNGIVQDYPPLADIRGSMTAQFEHTILLRPTCKEVVSRGDDY